MKSPEIITTSDTSNTLYSPEIDETYHSRHGAIQESEYIFIKKGLSYFPFEKYPTLDILEIGLGTALNALLTLIRKPENQTIHYTALEPFPITTKTASQLNYSTKLKAATHQFLQFHTCDFNKDHKLSTTFTFKKMNTTFQKNKKTESHFKNKTYTLIYYDAFGPRAQANMWTKECFKKAYSLLMKNGALVTFCAKGEVKRKMKEAGFSIETLPGPPGKREITRAIKK